MKTIQSILGAGLGLILLLGGCAIMNTGFGKDPVGTIATTATSEYVPPKITPIGGRPGWFYSESQQLVGVGVTEIPLWWATLECAGGFDRPQAQSCVISADDWLPKMSAADQAQYHQFVACVQGSVEKGKHYTPDEAFAIGRVCDPPSAH
jgi:hypothetical protein